MKKRLLNCKCCGKEISKNAKSCPGCGAKNKKPLYKRPLLLVIAFLVIVLNLGNSDSNENTSETNTTSKTSQEVVAEISDTSSKSEPVKEEPSIPREYKSALRQAKTYSDMMHMSKADIFDQLTSEYGGQFSEEAAQYAIDNVDADWKKNALESAKNYQDMMAMSPKAIYDQLVSSYGGKFTNEEAQYAIDNLEE